MAVAAVDRVTRRYAHLSAGRTPSCCATRRRSPATSSRRSRAQGTPGQINRPLVRALGRARAADAGCSAARSPAPRAVPDPRGARAVLHRGGDRVRRAGARRASRSSPIGSPGGRRGLAAARGRRRGHRRLRAHRARCRVRRGRARAAGRAATATASASPARRSRSPTPPTPTSTRCSRAPRPSAGSTAFAVPRASEGLSGEPLALLSPHPIGRLDLRRRAGAGRPRPRRGRPGLQGRHADARPLSPERRRVRGRHGAGGARRGRRARHHARGVRPHAEPAAGRLAPARRRRHRACRPRACSSTAPRPPTTTACGRPPRPPRWRSCSPPRPRSEAIDVAIQVHGARALEEGHILEHLYREVRAHAHLRGRLGDPARDHRPPALPRRRVSRRGEIRPAGP